jgi:hypothetical protein
MFGPGRQLDQERREQERGEDGKVDRERHEV